MLNNLKCCIIHDFILILLQVKMNSIFKQSQMKAKPIIKKMELSKMDYFITHLSLINPILPVKLTTKEIEVLSCFLSFTGQLANDRFGTTGKRIVRETVQPNISHAGLANYIKSLINKKFIIKDEEGNLTILPILHPGNKEQQYMFYLICRDESQERIQTTEEG